MWSMKISDLLHGILLVLAWSVRWIILTILWIWKWWCAIILGGVVLTSIGWLGYGGIYYALTGSNEVLDMMNLVSEYGSIQNRILGGLLCSGLVAQVSWLIVEFIYNKYFNYNYYHHN